MNKIRKYTALLMIFALLFCCGCGAGTGSAEQSAETGETMAAYTVKVLDQDGAGVEGVSLQVCNDTSCMVYSTDKDGVCSFELPDAEYELHILKLPEGYEGDTSAVETLPAGGGELTVAVNKK